jgi:hypothetical protein
MKQGRTLGCATVVVFVITFIALFFLTGCTTTKVVTVEKVHNDTTYITQHQRDSIWLHDSISIKEKGDTIRIERWHTKYISKEVHDTLYRAKTDSIPVPYEVVKEVPRPRSKLELVVFCAGIISIMALFLFFVMKLKKFLP